MLEKIKNKINITKVKNKVLKNDFFLLLKSIEFLF